MSRVLVQEQGYCASSVCSLLGISRSTYYRSLHCVISNDDDVVNLIEDIILKRPGYGSRRISEELKREGHFIGRRRIQRIMRDHSLLCQLKKRWTRTTDSDHGHRRYPNLVRSELVERPDQVWAADITYLRLEHGFCYLSVILDAYSRKVVGWHLSKYIDSALTLRALNNALEERKPASGWIHHSDQAVQYACRGYIETILAHSGRPSMSSKACPYDNARAESFFATLKKEHTYQEDHSTFEETKAGLTKYIDEYYNQSRLHSSIGYLSPNEFEQSLTK